jgi:hypothetical protein
MQQDLRSLYVTIDFNVCVGGYMASEAFFLSYKYILSCTIANTHYLHLLRYVCTYENDHQTFEYSVQLTLYLNLSYHFINGCLRKGR